jgi:hypothetical protein
MLINYTIYKNPVFWLVNSRCIFRVFSYLGLISFLPLPGYLHEALTFLPLRASNRQIHSEYFFFTFIRKITWLIKFETWKCSEVKDLTFFPSDVVFAKTYFTFLPSRAANCQINSEYFNNCLTKQIEILPLYLLKGTFQSVL